MAAPKTCTPVNPAELPQWTAEGKFYATRLRLRILIALVAILWLVLLGWVLFYAPINNVSAAALEAGANLTLVLAPVVAAAAAVERTLESIFNVIEGSWRTLVAYLGRGLRWLKSAETEVKQARQFLADITDRYNAEMKTIPIGQATAAELAREVRIKIEDANAMLALAQVRVAKAEKELGEAPDSEKYKSAKVAASIVLGLMLGVIVAALGQLQLFAILGIDAVPARIDVLITGLVIGSGSYPVHSLIGILQQSKDTLDSIKGYYQRLAPSLQVTAERTRKLEPPAVPGGPPQVRDTLVETSTARSQEEEPPA